MSDYMAENPSPQNGPAPFPPAGGGPPRFAPPRPEAARPEPAHAEGNRTDATRTEAGRPPEQARPFPEVKGRIHIADEVVEKVAGLAAVEVEGVADVGGDFARAIESVRERIGIGSKRGDQGIKAEVKGNEVAISVTIMVEFGHVVLDVARKVQVNVARKTQRMLGLKVVEVNVTVDDVRTTRPERPERSAEVAVEAG
ncbi:MAG TPA: Asp23/Gls24 family envelope stress response protein [Acidimicrobiales bacterium]